MLFLLLLLYFSVRLTEKFPKPKQQKKTLRSLIFCVVNFSFYFSYVVYLFFLKTFCSPILMQLYTHTHTSTSYRIVKPKANAHQHYDTRGETYIFWEKNNHPSIEFLLYIERKHYIMYVYVCVCIYSCMCVRGKFVQQQQQNTSIEKENDENNNNTNWKKILIFPFICISSLPAWWEYVSLYLCVRFTVYFPTFNPCSIFRPLAF